MKLTTDGYSHTNKECLLSCCYDKRMSQDVHKLAFFYQIKHQIESSISNLQGNLKPGSAVRGFNTNQQQSQRPTFEESEDDDEDESSASSFGGQRDSSSFGPPPSINFGDTERYKRGSQTQERFHKNDKNAGGKNTQKTFRQPLPKIQYNRPGKKLSIYIFNLEFELKLQKLFLYDYDCEHR